MGSIVEKYISSIARYQNDIALIKLSKDVEINGQFLSNSFPFSQFQLFFWTFCLLVRFRWANLSSICHRVQWRTSSQCHGSCCRVRTLRHWGHCHQFAIIIIAIVIVLFSRFSTSVLSQFHKCSRWGAVDMFARKFPVLLQFVQDGSFFSQFLLYQNKPGF